MLKAQVLTSLRVFEVVARTLSFAVAAEQLCVTTGAVSQQIRKLETELGCELFSRAARSVQLTTEGEQLLAAVAPAMQMMTLAVDGLQQRSHTVIRLAASPSLAFHWLTPRLPDFQRRYPQIRIEVCALDNTALGRGGYDLILAYGPAAAVPAGMQAIELMSEQLVPVRAVGYQPDFDWQQPGHWTGVALLHDSEAWLGAVREAEWLAWLEAYQPEQALPEQQFYFNRMDMAVEAAAAGLGIALARRRSLPELLNDGRLVVSGPELKPDWGYRMLLPERYQQSTQLTALAHWLVEQAG